MGAAAGLGSRAATFSAYRPDDRAFRERERWRSPSTTTRLLTAYVEGRERTPAQLLADAAAQTRDAVLYPVFAGLGRDRCRRPRADGRDQDAPPAPRRRTRRPSRPGACSRWSAGQRGRRSPTSGCSAAPCAPVSGSTCRAGGSARSAGSRCSTGAVGCAPTRSDRAGSGGCTGSPPSAWATASAPRSREDAHHFAPPTLEASVEAVDPAQAAGAPGGARPPRRPGPADRRPDGRGRAAHGLAVRAGAAGGARLDPGRGARDRGGVLRRQRAARRASPEVRGGGAPAEHRREPVPGHHRPPARSRGRPDPVSSSGSRSPPGTCRSTCSRAWRRSRRPSRSTYAASWHTGATAGRSPTAWSR